MKSRKIGQNQPNERKNERGAALITVIMISFLLLTASFALLFEASLNTANVTDVTSEEQAYYAAESGIQSVVNVLRGNVVPNPLIDTTKPATDPTNKITYSKAVRLTTSNLTTAGLDTSARLSRWMSYCAGFTDRVAIGDCATYNALNGFAYSVTVTDPDNVGGVIEFGSTGSSYVGTPGTLVQTRTGANPLLDTARIEFIPAPAGTVVDVSTGIANTNLGRWRLSATGAGATFAGTIPFAIHVQITRPWNTGKIIRGFIEPGTITPTSATVKIFYESAVFIAGGSAITLEPPSAAAVPNPGSFQYVDEYGPTPGSPVSPPTGPFGTYLLGYRLYPFPPQMLQPLGADTLVTASMTPPEPVRLLIRSTGFGPHGARKQLEAVIQRDYFNGLGAPSPLTLVGPNCTPVATCITGASTSAPWFVFDHGNANASFYTGRDENLRTFLPPIGVTNQPNLTRVNTLIASRNPDIQGAAADVTYDLPWWLQNPRNLDVTVQQLRASAQATGRYYGPAAATPATLGDFASGTGITFIDRDLNMSPNVTGGGILVVTGTLTFQGAFDFRGLILVTGPGGATRSGGGNGNLAGNMVVAPYNAASIACTPPGTNGLLLSCFLAPRYDLAGGGSSTMQYNSNNVVNGVSALTNFVKGVAEK